MSVIALNKNTELLMCDIDGTLVNKGEDLLPKTKQSLINFHDQGVSLGLATGRPIDNRIIDKFNEWNLDFDVDYIIGSNGCEIWDKDTNKVYTSDQLDIRLIKEIVDMMWDEDVNIIIFEKGYNHVLAKRMDDALKHSTERNNSIVEFAENKERFYQHPTCKVELHYNEEVEERLLEIIRKNNSKEYDIIKTYTGTLEFQKPGVSKGRALKQICEKYNININNVIGCGDMENDIALIKEAGTGICLCNGCDEAKKVADYVTDLDVSNDGLGDFFEKHCIFD